MNVLLIVAALSTAVAALGHSVTGEREVIRPLFAMPGVILDRPRMRLAWHLASLAWLGIALVFLLAAFGSIDEGAHRAIRHLALALGVSAMVVFVVGRG